MKESTLRQTNPASCTLHPTFSYHAEFPLPVVTTSASDDGGHVTSLAEMMDEGCLVCEALYVELKSFYYFLFSNFSSNVLKLQLIIKIFSNVKKIHPHNIKFRIKFSRVFFPNSGN